MRVPGLINRAGQPVGELPLDLPGLTVTRFSDGNRRWTSHRHDGVLKKDLLATLRVFWDSTRWLRQIDRSIDGDPGLARYYRLAALWGQGVVRDGGFDVVTRGFENLRRGAVYLFAPTHTSYLDVLFLLMALEEKNLGFVTEEYLKKAPYLGRPLSRAGTMVFVNREDQHSRSHVVGAVKDLLDDPDNVSSMVVFPQGTRDCNPFAHKLWPGVAQMFLRINEKRLEGIVPMVINGTCEAFPKHARIAQRGGRIEIIAGRPIGHSDIPRTPASTVAGTRQATDHIMDQIGGFYRDHYHRPPTETR